jgi:hypothetical protein
MVVDATFSAIERPERHTATHLCASLRILHGESLLEVLSHHDRHFGKRARYRGRAAA